MKKARFGSAIISEYKYNLLGWLFSVVTEYGRVSLHQPSVIIPFSSRPKKVELEDLHIRVGPMQAVLDKR